jgi:hypothetical protein
MHLVNILRIFAFKFKGHSNSNNALISMGVYRVYQKEGDL